MHTLETGRLIDNSERAFELPQYASDVQRYGDDAVLVTFRPRSYAILSLIDGAIIWQGGPLRQRAIPSRETRPPELPTLQPRLRSPMSPMRH